MGLTFVTEFERRLEAQSKTFESRMVAAIESNDQRSINELQEEAKQIRDAGYFSPWEYRTLTDMDLWEEILG